MNTKIMSAVVASLLLTPVLATASDCGYGNKAMKTAHSPSNHQGNYIQTMSHAKPAAQDIVDTAVGAGFNTLAAAVTAAGLVDTLKGNGPFTVFAPTDEAFAKIPADTLQGLLADKEALRKILLYHVVAGKVEAKDVVTLSSATTAQGSNVMIDTSNGVKVNGANVLKTDIMTSNGIIHVIDTVLIPK